MTDGQLATQRVAGEIMRRPWSWAADVPAHKLCIRPPPFIRRPIQMTRLGAPGSMVGKTWRTEWRNANGTRVPNGSSAWSMTDRCSANLRPIRRRHRGVGRPVVFQGRRQSATKVPGPVQPRAASETEEAGATSEWVQRSPYSTSPPNDPGSSRRIRPKISATVGGNIAGRGSRGPANGHRNGETGPGDVGKAVGV